MTQNESEYLDIDQLVVLVGRTPSAVYSERYRGQGLGSLGVRVGRRLVWRRSDIEAWFDEQLRREPGGRDGA